MPKRAVFERSRRELSSDVSVGVHIILVVEQSSLENQSRGCAKTPILTVDGFRKHVVKMQILHAKIQYKTYNVLPICIKVLKTCLWNRRLSSAVEVLNPPVV